LDFLLGKIEFPLEGCPEIQTKSAHAAFDYQIQSTAVLLFFVHLLQIGLPDDAFRARFNRA
jgi:hypothetical protein